MYGISKKELDELIEQELQRINQGMTETRDKYYFRWPNVSSDGLYKDNTSSMVFKYFMVVFRDNGRTERFTNDPQTIKTEGEKAVKKGYSFKAFGMNKELIACG